ncbi:hypothetical protein LINGRAHAP2_LOCUS5586 [Linum grandiflorum]
MKRFHPQSKATTTGESTKLNNYRASTNLSTLASDPSSKLDVLGHDGNPLGVDSAEVGILEQSDEVSLSSFLESRDGGALEPQIGLEILGDLTDKALEGELADEKLSALLVLADLTEGDGSWPESVGLLHSSGRRS